MRNKDGQIANPNAPTTPSLANSDHRGEDSTRQHSQLLTSNRPPAVHPITDQTRRTDPNSQQESRPPRHSTASNRTAPPPSPPKPAPEPHGDDKPLETPRSSGPPHPSARPNQPPAAASASRPRPEARREKPISAAAPERPPLTTTVSQMDTKYVNMLLALDGIPPLYNILASFFTWILLAGFVLFPGTFTNLEAKNQLGGIGVAAVNVIKHLSLYVVAWVCTIIGAVGMSYLWYRWQANYIWLVNRIFMPGFLNSLAGVLSTLASVLGSQDATLSISSKSTIIVTSSLAGICGGLTAFYMFVLIRRIKKQHDEEIGKQRAGKHGEGFVDVSKRKFAAKLV
ncbi:hypothetical protein B0H15DRAFT_772621 [Mycena belliarum]|uniref:Uncharacterized protein n=1 Tax=Mycena belliarum TaxID=1033014 RepID=A0AAD6XYP1_9AGAR|nr:hypothetical protein B0H15DRAFT_772621 [Mycena belliae]